MKVGSIATLIGLLTFILHWNLWELWDGPLPGYQILLLPGNLTLEYIWHPLFTEEINLLPKLSLILTGQFVITFVVALIIHILIKKNAPEVGR